MEPEPSCLLVLQKCNVHSYKNKKKNIVQYGSCKILQNQSSVTFKIDAKTFPFENKSFFVKLTEPKYANYLTSGPNDQVFSFSFPTPQTQINEFENLMKTFDILIVDYNSPQLNPKVKKAIQENCNIEGSSIGSTEVLQDVGQTIGLVFGAIGGALNLSSANQKTNQTMNRLSQEYVSPSTTSKWERFKNKVSEVNDDIAEKMKPVSTKVKEETTKLGEKFDTSQNTFIKGLREFSQKASSSMSEGYVKGQKSQQTNVRVVSFKKQEEKPVYAEPETPQQSEPIIREQK